MALSIVKAVQNIVRQTQCGFSIADKAKLYPFMDLWVVKIIKTQCPTKSKNS